MKYENINVCGESKTCHMALLTYVNHMLYRNVSEALCYHKGIKLKAVNNFTPTLSWGRLTFSLYRNTCDNYVRFLFIGKI